jgi:hypothetical protein
MKGSVRITVKIGRNGEVLSATPGAVHDLSPTVASCCAAVAASKTFDRPTSGEATVAIPVTFFPE